MTAALGLGEKSCRASHPPEPLPSDPTGQRLCEIFGHYRWNFIQADQPEKATAKPSWTTIKTHPIRPRALWAQWQDANQLIGVRFTHKTRYALIDLDAGGAYSSAEGVAKIRAALETIGLTRTLLIRSSWRNGLHLYLPLAELVNTFDLAVALKECLKAQGFQIKAGQLEIFPNVKAYGVQTFTEYNAHRLPLQPGSGSCVLDDALNPQADNLARFFWLWDGAAAQQDLETLRHAMTIGRDNHRKRPKRRSHPVETWRQDLDTEIGEGWTAHGQTNHLLKTIACYGRVFEKLEGQALIDYIHRMAINSPGYSQYCRHQHNIEDRVRAWATAAENYYWPLGTTASRDHRAIPKNNLVPFNQRQSEDAQHRIAKAYREMEEAGTLPDQITARVKALTQSAHVSQQTLYRYLSLWHPYHQPGVMEAEISITPPEETPVATPPQPPESLAMEGLHPRSTIMKGGGLPQGEAGSDPNSFTPDRGVRGDEPSFPQAPDPADLGFLADVAEICHKQAERLGWTAMQMGQFIADQFEGKRRWQLSDDELMTLLYRLQGVVADDGPPGSAAREL